MRRLVLAFIIGTLAMSHAGAQTGYPISPVPFTAVKVSPGTFWGQRLEASRNTTVPLAFSKCAQVHAPGFGLFRVRSPLLAESMFLSLPPAT